MRETIKKISLVAIFCSGFACHALPSCIAELVTKGIGHVRHDESSFVRLDVPLVPTAATEAILQRTLKDFSKNGSLENAHFFSQFTIDEEGRLHVIIDKKVEKDAGDEIARQWEKDLELRKQFAEVYDNVKKMADEIRHSLPEAELELAEVVFTLQVNKVSENWHMDWYPQEYLIATQTFLAKRLAEDGSLVDEDVAGTEYLLYGPHPEMEDLMLRRAPKSIEFEVKTEPPIFLVGKGWHYSTPTHALSVHSGVSRVHSRLGIAEDSLGMSMGSPPHRGSYKPLAIRGSLAIRFKRKNHIVLRQLALDDVDFLVSLSQDPEISDKVGKISAEEARKMFLMDIAKDPKHLLFRSMTAVELDGQFVGSAGLWYFTPVLADKLRLIKPGEHWAQVGRTLSSDAQGKGVGTVVAKRLAEYALDTMKLDGVMTQTNLTNVAARRSIENAGFRYAGEDETHVIYIKRANGPKSPWEIR